MSLKNCALAIAAVFLFSASSMIATTANAGGSLKDSGYDHEWTYPFATFSGTDISEDNYESYFGVVYALNGDLDKDGFILRSMFTYGDFDYVRGVTDTDGDYWQGDLLLGYQIIRDAVNYHLLIGVDYQDYDLTPADPSNPINGDEVGFKVAGGIETERYRESPVYAILRGSYSTSFDTYYALGRLGRELRDDWVLGVEGWAFGDESGDAQRVGAFLMHDIKFGSNVGTVSVSGGYQFTDEGDYNSGIGEEGAYGTLKFTMAYGR